MKQGAIWIVSEESESYSRLLIDKAKHVLFAARQKELAPYHIAPQQAYILFILCNLGHKATLAEMARHTERGVATISITMARMEKDGLVKGVRETPKSVLLKFELTEKGRSVYKNIKIMAADKEIMSVLSEQEQKQLTLTLKKIISKAETYINT